MNIFPEVKKAILLAEKQASLLGVLISIAIVDQRGELIAASRMEGAPSISLGFAQKKAYSSAIIGLPTEKIEEYAKKGPQQLDVTNAFEGGLMAVPGGVPIKEGLIVVGGVGVSGSEDTQADKKCAEKALLAFFQKIN